MSAPVRVGLVGISGYGEHYVRALLDEPPQSNFKLVAVADPNPQLSSRLDQLGRQGTSVYPSIDALTTGSEVDLLAIATPLHMHAQHIRHAMSRGINVLCEKPLAATFDQARQLAADHAKSLEAFPASFVGIGFQWSFSAAMEHLKRDVMNGEFGLPLRLRAIALYPRPITYYSRNSWAGRKYSVDGAPIFDSPVNNAASHFLHAMLYVLGSARDLSATPVELTAEIYRANPIETFDCAAIRVRTRAGVELLFYAAHCVHEQFGPAFRYEFEHAVVEYSSIDGKLIARFADGRTKFYGNPSDDPMRKIWSCIDASQTGEAVACGIAATLPHALCASAAYGPTSTVHEIPRRFIRRHRHADSELVAVDGLGDGLIGCYEKAQLPWESGDSCFAWAQRGQEVNLQSARWRIQPSPREALEVLS